MQVEGGGTRPHALAAAGRALQAAGADFIVLCTNTMHKVADAVADAVDVPLLHIGDTTAEAVDGAGVRRVGLLGRDSRCPSRSTTSGSPRTASTCSSRPSRTGRSCIAIIYDELCVGVVREESREAYRQVIRRLVDAGAEGVIYGCTEIELLVGPEDSPVPVFPTTRLHVEAAVERALAGSPVRRPELP